MTDGKIDIKEGIYFGPDVSANDPDVICGTPMVGPNQFPDEADLPGFSTTIKQYKENMKSVGCVKGSGCMCMQAMMLAQSVPLFMKQWINWLS